MSAGAAPREIGFQIFGVRFVVETRLEELISALAPRLPPGPPLSAVRGPARRYVVDTAERPGTGFVVRRALRKPAHAPSVEIAADLIVIDLQRTLAHRADGLVFVHAGVVACEGRALVLPGRSRSGKSELVAALVRAGAEYLSDEFAVFDGDGLVRPYARAIALRQGEGTRVWMRAEALGARAAARPVPPGLIAFLRFSPASRWRPRRLSAGQTVLGLLRHAVAARRRLALVRSVLVPVASSVAAMSAVRGEADELAGQLLRELASAPSFGTIVPQA
jgi:hypothetical protein